MTDQTDIQPQDTQPKAQRDERGRLLAPLPGGAPKITSANARSMAKKRWDAARRAAAAAVIEEGRRINENVASAPAVWGLVNVHLFNTIMKSDKPRPQAVELLGKNIGALANEWEKDQPAGESALESDLRGLIRAIADRIGVIPEQLRATNNEQNEDNG